jgi:hypothetical protein
MPRHRACKHATSTLSLTGLRMIADQRRLATTGGAASRRIKDLNGKAEPYRTVRRRSRRRGSSETSHRALSDSPFNHRARLRRRTVRKGSAFPKDRPLFLRLRLNWLTPFHTCTTLAPLRASSTSVKHPASHQPNLKVYQPSSVTSSVDDR